MFRLKYPSNIYGGDDLPTIIVIAVAVDIITQTPGSVVKISRVGLDGCSKRLFVKVILSTESTFHVAVL